MTDESYTMGYAWSTARWWRVPLSKHVRTLHDYTYIDLYVKYLFACNLNF